MNDRYPKNWTEIALQIKEQAEWKCSKCKRQFKKGDRRLQVHHCDYTPENNDPSNLISLCAGCHLEKHQGKKGNVCIGQLSLPLDFD
jgi:predicted HNH restriction endonuclease